MHTSSFISIVLRCPWWWLQLLTETRRTSSNIHFYGRIGNYLEMQTAELLIHTVVLLVHIVVLFVHTVVLFEHTVVLFLHTVVLLVHMVVLFVHTVVLLVHTSFAYNMRSPWLILISKLDTKIIYICSFYKLRNGFPTCFQCVLPTNMAKKHIII
jgi:hypothetical protein